MYDSHIYSPDYKSFKDTIVDILNGDDTDTDIDELTNRIQAAYDEGTMQATQYDDLMRYIQDIM